MVVTMSKIDVPDAPVLQFLYAPNDITISPAPSWSARSAAGAVTSRSDWTGNGPEKVSVSTRQSVSPANADRLENLLETLRAWVKFPTDLTQAPSRAALAWGDFYYTGVLTDLQIKKEVVDDRGRALVATIDFTLLESI